MNREQAIEAAEANDITFEFADYWVDVYLDVFDEDATIDGFVKFVTLKKEHTEEPAKVEW